MSVLFFSQKINYILKRFFQKILFTSIAFITFLSIYSPNSLGVEFNAVDFGTINETSLCFDLRSERDLKAGLITSINKNDLMKDISYILPFQISEPNINERTLTRWGSTGNYTVITQLSDQIFSGTNIISFRPEFSEFSHNYIDINNLSRNLYFINIGLEKHFIYKYPDSDKNITLWREIDSKIEAKAIRHIAIIIPENATGVEIDNSGKTAIPEQEFILGKAKFYPGSAKYSGDHRALVIYYRVPPTNLQKNISSSLAKTITILISPIVSSLIISPSGIQDARIKSKILSILLAIQILLIGAFFILTILKQSEESFTSLADIIVAIIGAGATIFVEREKGRINQQP